MNFKEMNEAAKKEQRRRQKEEQLRTDDKALRDFVAFLFNKALSTRTTAGQNNPFYGSNRLADTRIDYDYYGDHKYYVDPQPTTASCTWDSAADLTEALLSFNRQQQAAKVLCRLLNQEEQNEDDAENYCWAVEEEVNFTKDKDDNWSYFIGLYNAALRHNNGDTTITDDTTGEELDPAAVLTRLAAQDKQD